MTEALVRPRSMASVVDTLQPGRLWRIKGSGVCTFPSTAPLTAQIIDGLSSVGVQVTEQSSGTAANADSYTVRARFLDGGIEGQTGNYMAAPRGVHVEGPRALVFISVLLGRNLPASLLAQLRSADHGIDAHIDSCRGQGLGPLGIPNQCGYPVFPQTEIFADVLRAYLETRYEAQMLAKEPLTLKIGEFSRRLLSTHREAGVESSLFVTAYNPSGRQLTREENEKRHRELLKRLRKGRVVFFKGRGHHPSSDWEERSVLGLGVSLAAARYLGKMFGQDAIVWSGADAVPRLILLR